MDAIPLGHEAQELLFLEARSANTFTDEPVTDGQLHAIWDLMKWAPTSGNINPLRILFLRSPEARERMVQHMSEGNQGKTRSAPMAALLAADRDFHEFVPQLFPDRADQVDWYATYEGRGEMATFNATLQAAYFIIAVRAVGLAAGPMSGFDYPAMDAEFFPDGRHSSVLAVNLGRPGPDAWFPRLPRLDFAQAVTVL
ncbi:MAG: malonic semialdehyde reductase [Miltoncostaeaceae bacterium]